MKSSVIRYVLVIVVAAFLGYNSVYFRKLDELQAAIDTTAFNADRFARELYSGPLVSRVDSAVEMSALISMLRSDPAQTFNKYSNAAAVGNLRYFLVRGEGMITSLDDNRAGVQLRDLSIDTHVDIATEFVYGNSIRDASALVDLKDFSNTADFNGISESINRIIRTEVIPPFLADLEPGRTVRFAGAIELNQKYLRLDTIEVVPIKLDIIR